MPRYLAAYGPDGVVHAVHPRRTRADCGADPTTLFEVPTVFSGDVHHGDGVCIWCVRHRG